MERRNLDSFYVSGGIEQYFLPELPDWVRFSQTGKCFLDKSTKYLNFERLNQSYSLSYEQLVQMQYSYNKKIIGKDNLQPKEEEVFFYNTYDQVQAGSKEFIKPTYKRVNIIWIDDIFTGTANKSRLRILLNSKDMDLGHPVLVSLCLSENQLTKFVSSVGMNGAAIKLMPREMFTVFNYMNKKHPYFALDFSQIFDKKQKLYFYTTRTSIPVNFKGKLEVKKY
jgi:hypothetical protein